MKKSHFKLSDCVIRTCYSMHMCCVCNKTIFNGDKYYDGGHGKRAHDECVKNNDKQLVDNTTVIPNYMWSSRSIPIPIKEYKFDPRRKWRIDFAWPDLKIGIEIQGGIHNRGRHVRGKGYEGDMKKYNAMNVQNWLLLLFTPNKINYDLIKEAHIIRAKKLCLTCGKVT